MYLSCLLIDTGDNPDRPRPGRTWLRNLYHVHQRLCMAFPCASQKSDDPDFLTPFTLGHFARNHVHVKREADHGFLYRVDPQPRGGVVILVQSGSAVKPDWNYAFHNARYLLTAEPEVKEFDPSFTKEQRLRFRLAANPTRRLSKHSLERDGKPAEAKWIGKRVPVPHDRLLDWLAEWRLRQDGRDEPSGFRIHRDRTTVQSGYIYFKKLKEGQESHTEDRTGKERHGGGPRLFSVRYEGILEVTEPDKFRNTLLRGIGPGKAFGFGLLSVAPCRTSPSTEAL